MEKHELLNLIDNMIERIEEMPQQMKHIPLNHTDMLCMLGIMRDILRVSNVEKS
jgi:hypothetical protein